MGSQVLYRIINSSLEIIMDVLLSIPSTLVALAAALSQCEEDFNEEVDHMPKSFSKLTSLNSICDLGKVDVCIVYRYEHHK